MKPLMYDPKRSALCIASCIRLAEEDQIENLPQPGRLYRIGNFITDLLLFCLLMILWLFSESVLAGNESESDNSLDQPPYRSLWLKSHDGITTYDATTLASDVSMTVSGPILRARVCQQFRNPSQWWAEGIYTYPLPEQASIDQMRMRIGERVIEGQIHEKQLAKKIYQQAREAGKRSSLLNHHRSNVFTTSVANIGPGEMVTVEFEYQQVLDYRDHRYGFRFPMVSTPQYTPSGARHDSEFVEPVNVIKSEGESPGNPVSITVQIDAGFPIKAPVSSSHSVDVLQVSESSYQVRLPGTAALSNRDFVLSWQIEATSEPMVRVLREEIEGSSYGLLMVMPPQPLAGDSISQPRELVLVLDVSGSMQGESIEQARSAVLKAISQLGSEDSFNIIFFNTHAWQLFPESRVASNQSLTLARHAVLNQGANGGTEMRPALQMALNGSGDPEVLRQVIFITDGAVSNEAELFSVIQQRLGRSRLFTVGIGSAPNSYFMRKAALAGRGTFTYISKPDEVGGRINSLLRQLEMPALTDLGFDLNADSAIVLPDPLPDLYLGEPVYATFKADHFPEEALLSARLRGVPSQIRVPLHHPVDHPGIAIEWARRQIIAMLAQHREASETDKARIRSEVVDLAIAHHQVSPFTSLVAVDVSPARAGGQLKTDRISANRPKGWQGQSGPENHPIRLAQTATDAPFRLLTGLGLLLAALLLWFGRGLVLSGGIRGQHCSNG